MKNFDSYKILEQTRKIASERQSDLKSFLRSTIEKAKGVSPKNSDIRKEKNNK
ncbi:hypothetical protein JW926_14405 [Candidatus Sumerlaeota bacterium]|nr:hypothetical protein [Candidatus Sumerlaeota bacterium]